MSSNHHIGDTIHLGNYEAFFLLYMDGELSPVQMDAVAHFLQAHPDLQGAFDLLLTTKLDGEAVVMDKEALLSPAMHQRTAEEDLLLYIDNELDEGKRQSVAQAIIDNQYYSGQYYTLLKARLDPAEAILHPDKKELYRRTERGVRAGFWLRVAAVLLLLASAVVFFLGGEREGVPAPGVARAPQKAPAERVLPAPVQSTAGERETKETGIAMEQQQRNTRQRAAQPRQQLPAPVENLQPQEEQLASLPQEQLPAVREKHIIHAQHIEAATVSEEIFNKGAVTNGLALRNTVYATPDAQATTEVASRKGSLKGFLRKATRLIERTTGIDATNSEDELLISAVAIKLK